MFLYVKHKFCFLRSRKVFDVHDTLDTRLIFQNLSSMNAHQFFSNAFNLKYNRHWMLFYSDRSFADKSYTRWPSSNTASTLLSKLINVTHVIVLYNELGKCIIYFILYICFCIEKLFLLEIFRQNLACSPLFYIKYFEYTYTS